MKNGMRIKDVIKKYDVSFFTVCKQLRKGDLSAKPRKGPTKLKEEKKLVQILEKSPRDFGLNYDFWTLKLIAYILEK
ncbi:ORF1 in transposon ISC1078 [Saccharolobus solfataricus]|uniref:ORF1 in transposon ISC1078 n=1 Tax=Saccharolobus solfataricus TaxID=2287 RepID=A0A0E3MFW7_SACSO|nr:ORF1 in transposon ISC1078 [Saccharolobus solfataricus]